MTGLFISFEGVDGVGKTTQVERLRDYLEAAGREVVVTREPGGTALGGSLRQLLLREPGDAAEVVRPALERGAVVITDRYLDSSLAYQAGGRELTADDVRGLSMWATGGLMPVRTYLLDMDPTAAHRRLQHDADRMESAGDEFQQRTRQAFLDLAGHEPGRFRVIDAAWPIEAVWEHIKADVDAVLADAAADERAAAQAAAAQAAVTKESDGNTPAGGAR